MSKLDPQGREKKEIIKLKKRFMRERNKIEILKTQLTHFDRHKIAHAALLAGVFFGQITFLKYHELTINSCSFNYLVFVGLYLVIVVLGVYELNRFNDFRKKSTETYKKLEKEGYWDIPQ